MRSQIGKLLRTRHRGNHRTTIKSLEEQLQVLQSTQYQELRSPEDKVILAKLVINQGAPNLRQNRRKNASPVQHFLDDPNESTRLHERSSSSDNGIPPSARLITRCPVPL
ncbi:hypothetical protein JTE90_022779 [Oedothorax gibbosus]|uniref:Uncharacterized protein n=1 Tax=Oedothorax gibbosus TaxID=931172 RepID=A0AAV6U974_9ARAC|nr:hypothetical protein JTE90_022779 [Oedothorax gibbosus]